MGFKSTHAPPPKSGATRDQQTSNMSGPQAIVSDGLHRPDILRTSNPTKKTTNAIRPTSKESSQTASIDPTNKPLAKTLRKLDHTFESVRSIYPGGMISTKMAWSLSGRPLGGPTASTPRHGNRVQWTESKTLQGSRITKVSKPKFIRLNGKTMPVNERNTTTNAMMRCKYRYARRIGKSAQFALAFCAIVLAAGAVGTYTVVSLDSEIQQLRAIKSHQEETIGMLQGRLNLVQKVVDKELTGNSSTMAVLVAVSNVLSWAAGNVIGQ